MEGFFYAGHSKRSYAGSRRYHNHAAAVLSQSSAALKQQISASKFSNCTQIFRLTLSAARVKMRERLHELTILLSLLYFALCNTESCVTPNGETGKCIPYTQCANLSGLHAKYNFKHREDALKLVCNNTENDVINICCTEMENAYYTGADFESALNKSGVEILLSLSCGTPSSDRIAGGSQAALGQFPWMALLRYDDDTNPFKCGGSLITNRYVLTADHCIANTLIGVRLGEHNITSVTDCLNIGQRSICMPPVEDFGIEHVIRYSRQSSILSHDVALLKLNKNVEFKMHIKPICLPTQVMTIASEESSNYVIAGWGRKESDNQIGVRSETLLTATVPHRERDECKKIFKSVPITYNHICAGGELQTDTCKGDSGGPLFALAPYQNAKGVRHRYFQFGIVSFGLSGCGSNRTKASVYANVVQHMPWITSNIF